MPNFLVILLKPLSMHRFTYIHVQSRERDRTPQVAAQPFPWDCTWGTCPAPLRSAQRGFHAVVPRQHGLCTRFPVGRHSFCF